jgi:3'(2'), 5'-bisphosphate nucleotidase
MADARAQQGGKIERFDGRSGHELVSAGRAGCQKTGESLDAPVSVRDTPHPTDRQAPARGNLQAVTSGITPQQAERHLDALTEIVSRAAAATLATSFSSVERRIKDDLSPVTAADEASEAVIVEGVSRLLPGIAVIAEESVGRAAAASLEPSFVVVDPLDGTKEFLAGRDEFTVNVAIVTHGVPIAGLIAAPAQGLLWRGVVGGKAERLRLRFGTGPAQAYDRSFIRARPAPDRLIVATSRSHLDEATEDFLARLPVAKRFLCGSSVKFCYLAQGEADVYPRLSPTHEWDIAAGCAILAAAGGTVTDPNGGQLQFGRQAEKFLVPGFIAWGDPAKTATSKPATAKNQ